MKTPTKDDIITILANTICQDNVLSFGSLCVMFEISKLDLQKDQVTGPSIYDLVCDIGATMVNEYIINTYKFDEDDVLQNKHNIYKMTYHKGMLQYTLQEISFSISTLKHLCEQFVCHETFCDIIKNEIKRKSVESDKSDDMEKPVLKVPILLKALMKGTDKIYLSLSKDHDKVSEAMDYILKEKPEGYEEYLDKLMDL